MYPLISIDQTPMVLTWNDCDDDVSLGQFEDDCDGTLLMIVMITMYATVNEADCDTLLPKMR